MSFLAKFKPSACRIFFKPPPVSHDIVSPIRLSGNE